MLPYLREYWEIRPALTILAGQLAKSLDDARAIEAVR